MLQTNLIERKYKRLNSIGPNKVYVVVAAYISNGKLEVVGEDDKGRLYESDIGEVELIARAGKNLR